MSSKKHKRYKLLLDEGLPLPNSYPNLKNLHDLLHIVQTKHRGKKDSAIFKLAEKDERIPIVFNTKDFKPLITKTSISVISLSSNLTNQQADLKICKTLKKLKVDETKGCLIAISNSGIKIKREIND